MTAVTADLGFAPDSDVLRPRFWIGAKVPARLQARDEARRPAAIPGGVSFVWVGPGGLVLTLPGVAVTGQIGLYACDYVPPTTGEWAVRAVDGDGTGLLDWARFTVTPEPPVGSPPGRALWLGSDVTALVTLAGQHLAAVTIPDLPVLTPDELGGLPDGLAIPVVDTAAPGGPASARVTMQVIRDDAASAGAAAGTSSGAAAGASSGAAAAAAIHNAKSIQWDDGSLVEFE